MMQCSRNIIGRLSLVCCFLYMLISVLNFPVLSAQSKSKSTEFSPNSTETAIERKDECGHTMTRPPGRFDKRFWKNFFRHLNPFTDRTRAKMQFFLYKREFPECGREMLLDDNESLQYAGFNASHPTRVIIHGWMSQGRSNLGRLVKTAYLTLLNGTDGDTNERTSTIEEAPVTNAKQYNDYNIIIIDWGLISTNINYYNVVELIEDLGFRLAEFLRFLHLQAGLHFGDVYVIGHSMGAQIAGSAGKQLQPYRLNTIFALDPAGPKFRDLNVDQRLDASDADYVESIQTSRTFGFEEPVGHASFYPNFGRRQRNCHFYGCSHRRSYHYFAESITSTLGFWGTKVEKQSDDSWLLLNLEAEYRMGGEPSTPKRGTFYVKTNKKSPYALGKQRQQSHRIDNTQDIDMDGEDDDEGYHEEVSENVLLT